MIGGISFSATSVTSGLDADKPVNPRPGHQYLATDTKVLYACYGAGVWVDTTNTVSGLDVNKPANPKPGNQYLATDTKVLYVCYNAGVWVNAAPPITAYGDISMVAGTATILFSDANVHSLYVNNTNYTTIRQYTVGDINRFFTEANRFNVSCDFWRDTLGGSTLCIVKVNGVVKLNNTIENNSNSWVTVTDNITAELKPGDIIEVGMSYSLGNTTKELKYRNFTIKCAVPTFNPKVSLPLS